MLLTALWTTAGTGTAQIWPAGSVTWPSVNHANSTQLCNTHKHTQATCSSPILWLVFIPPSKTLSFKAWCLKRCHSATLSNIANVQDVFKMAQWFKYHIRPTAVTRSFPVNKRIKQTGSFLSRTRRIAQVHTHKLCSTEGLHLTLWAAALECCTVWVHRTKREFH